MSSWIDNLIKYYQSNDIGFCPKCGSSNIDVQKYNGMRESLTFICKDCKSSAHFDGTVKK